MARGKKLDNETVYKIMSLYFENSNYIEVAKQLDIPIGTIYDIVNRNKDKEEFQKLRAKKQDEFTIQSSRIIDKGILLLELRLNKALENQDEIEKLIEETKLNEDLTYEERTNAIKKLSKMQINNLNEITTAIGTIYDKRALQLGNTTQNLGIDNITPLINMLSNKESDNNEPSN